MWEIECNGVVHIIGTEKVIDLIMGTVEEEKAKIVEKLKEHLDSDVDSDI
ncbi:hypothetical protein [Bacillus sp. 1006-3]|nr:hypothetical protein [Bacillus sp. 1006-3]MCH4866799.1 hypothetical protein [Bacillus sp. 1006-3]